jgi:hypothetical protein
MIPKRPKKTTAYYRSSEYKKELKLKFYKWNHLKAAKVYYGMFDTSFNPYATDWLDKGRTKIMEKRAQAMFDSMVMMLRLRLDHVPTITRDKAKHKALCQWRDTQQQKDGRKYIVLCGTQNTIVPVQTWD